MSYYSLILLLQGFCLFHAYQNGNLQKWFFIIFFLPLVGGLIYLYAAFGKNIRTADISAIGENVKGVLVKNYRIEQLEKQLEYSDTIANKILLADEHLNIGNHQTAFEMYKSCLRGLYKDDVELLMKIVKSSYLVEHYSTTIVCGERLGDAVEFKHSEEKIALAWAYYREGQTEKAEKTFEELDGRFTNYKHRYEYAMFLKEEKRIEESKAKLEAVIDEIESIKGPSKKNFTAILKDSKSARNYL